MLNRSTKQQGYQPGHLYLWSKLAGTGDELSCGQVHDWQTDRWMGTQTDTGNDNTQRPKLASSTKMASLGGYVNAQNCCLKAKSLGKWIRHGFRQSRQKPANDSTLLHSSQHEAPNELNNQSHSKETMSYSNGKPNVMGLWRGDVVILVHTQQTCLSLAQTHKKNA